jgi:REP element-mobilizing transposase RayT
MPQSVSNILTHIIFSTKNRRPFLRDDSLRKEVHAILASEYKKLKCPALVVGGTEDHVHVLCRLHRTVAVSDLVKETKRESSIWVKDKEAGSDEFHWQSGYGVFSIGQSMVDEVHHYIRTQVEHHEERSFKEEFRRFLEKYEIDYDERYVWD